MTATATKDAHQQEQGQLVEFHELHVDTLAVVGDNVREVGDVSELAASIKTDGMIEPIVATMRAIVDEDGQDDLGVRFTVVAGHRRLAAAKLAGLETVPVILRAMDEEQRVRAMLVENLIRENLTPLEEARAYKRLVDEFDLTQRELSVQVGKSQGHISKRLALLQLPDAVRADVDSGEITIADAVELAKLAADPARVDAALDRFGPYCTMADAVERELADKARQDAIEERAVTAEKQQDHRVVRQIVDGYRTKLPKGVFRLAKNASYGSDVLNLDPKKHASLECHAIVIDEKSGDHVAVCTNRRNHPDAKTPTQRDRERWKGQDAAQRQTREERDARREQLEQIGEQRHVFVAELLSRKSAFSKTEALEITLHQAIENAVGQMGWQTTQEFATFLGLKVNGNDFAAAITKAAEASAAELSRIALAATLVCLDGERCGSWSDQWNEEDAGFLQLLERHGYVLSDTERAMLPASKTPKKKTTTRKAAS